MSYIIVYTYPYSLEEGVVLKWVTDVIQAPAGIGSAFARNYETGRRLQQLWQAAQQRYHSPGYRSRRALWPNSIWRHLATRLPRQMSGCAK